MALTHLYDSVRDRFAYEGTSVPQTFGWREPPRQLTGDQRIVWVPGDPAGVVGEIAGARSPGQNPRPLATLDELFTVHITGLDPAQPESERHQYEAARLLYDAWFRAVYLAAHGAFAQLSATWVIERANERRRGATMRVVASVSAVIPDEAHEVAPVDTAAEIDVEELDVSETFTVTAEDES